MALRRYTGLSPMRVNRDAKYSVTIDGHIKLEYRESQRVRYLLTSDEHPRLAKMVNDTKIALRGSGGGAFYLNEYCDVLVPDGEGGACYWAGNYETTLVFREGSLEVSPKPMPELRPGDEWPGPHVGIPYTLKAGAVDIGFELIDGRRRELVLLSDYVGAGAARALAQRLAAVKGTSGGTVMINERNAFFAPVGVAGDWRYLYLGDLDEDPWFPPPDGFERP